MPRLLPIVLALFTPFLLGLVSTGCGSSGGGGSGSSATSGVTSATSAQTTTAATNSSSGPIANTPPPTTPPPTTTGGNAAIPTTSEDRYYNPHVRGTLLNSCTSCHASSANPAAVNAYELSGFPTDAMSFNNTKDRTNDLDPESSLLLQKALGNLNHGGGAVLKRTDIGYAWIVNWIRQGSRLDEFVNAPRTFVRNIQPILDRGCFGCHSGGAGGFTVGTNLQSNFQEMLSETETAVPANSRVIRKNDGGINHAGGNPWAAGRPERDVVLQWILDGRRFN